MRVGRWWGIGVCVGEAKTVYMATERQQMRVQQRAGHTRHGGKAQCGSDHVPMCLPPFCPPTTAAHDEGTQELTCKC